MKVISAPAFRGRGPAQVENFLKDQLPRIQREREEAFRRITFEENFDRRELDIQEKTNLDVLLYNETSKRWENRTLSVGAGLSIVDNSKTRTLTVTATGGTYYVSGDADTDDSWRIRDESGDLWFEKRISGTWTKLFAIKE